MKSTKCIALPIAFPPPGWRYCDPTSHWSPVVIVGELVAGAPAAIFRHVSDPKYPLHVGVPLVSGCLTRVERFENGGMCLTVGDRGWLLVPVEQPQSSERRDAA
jgi:hypothetical protein